MNMLKLLQEVRGFAGFANRRPQTRQSPATFMPVKSFKGPVFQRKRFLKINIQDPPDIPHPVKIVFLHDDSQMTAGHSASGCATAKDQG